MKKITKTALVILLSLCLCIGMVPAGMLSAGAANGDSEPVGFSPDNFKAQIKKVSIGAPITGLDGKKYLPVDVHFFAAENLSDSDMVYFLEGYLKAQLKGGGLAESIRGLGMTLMGPLKTDVPLESNMWNWDWTPYETGGGQGVIKYNVPLLEESETQSVEQSQATGMTEVNGVKVGDEITLQNETVVNTNNIPEQIVQELFPDGPSVFSDPVTFTVEEASKYPKEITSSTDDKTVAPPQEVVLPYTGQPQECPYKATAGYTVSLNDPQTDAGIYTAALILNSGWKWTDGTTAAKPAVWAIDKATITSVTLTSSALLYNGKEQYPTIASVNAGSLSVPAEGYSVSYSATPKLSGFYTLNVKGKGNFTGSASAEFHIDTVEMDTCTHDFPREYVDNKDDATHKAFCTHCGGCLANAEKHDLKNEPVNDPETGKPAGKYRIVCTKCGYAVDGDCDHSVPREYVDNGNGTHDERCSRCHVVFKTNEAHDLKETPVLSTVLGYEIYNGEVSVDCTKCGYHEDQTCSHAGTGRDDYVPAKGSYPNFTHRSHCARCKKLMFEEEENCTPGEWAPYSLNSHHTNCTKCGQEIKDYCDFKGTRKITKFEATPHNGGEYNLFGFTRYKYRCWYTETCKICHGVRKGWFDYPIITVEDWADYRAAFESICKMSPEALQSFHEQDYLQGYKYFLLMPSWFLSPIYEATGTNEMNYANLQSGYLVRLTNTHEAGSCKMFDKNGKEIASYKPKDKKSSSPVGADGDENEDEGISEDELDMWSVTEEDGAVLGLSTDYLMTLPDGEYTYTACFSNENGQTAAVSVVFTIAHDENGTKVKNVHPLGTMVNADGDVVGMNLSKDTLYYTGELLTLPAVTLTSEMGVEYAEGEDYTLTYYQVVEDEDGEAVEVEIAKEDIKDIGTYNVVATPTRNGVLSGEAWAQFRVVESLPAIIGDVDGDGVVTINDATMIQKCIAEFEMPDNFVLKACDTNGDGIITISDATEIQKYVAEYEIPYPIGKMVIV